VNKTWKSNFQIALSAIILPVAVLSLFQNCSGFSTLSGTSGGGGSSAQNIAQNECEFVGPTILQSRLISVLNIAAGDVPVLNTAGQPTGEMMIASNLTTLGQGDPSQGVPADYSCSASKYKTAMMVMIDACATAMENPTTMGSLFPRGTNDYTALYQAFIGRAPTDAEISTISEAISGMGVSDAATSACAIVSSSLEALIVI
jgi:hypothetical protein